MRLAIPIFDASSLLANRQPPIFPIASSFTIVITCVVTIFRRRHTVGLLEFMPEMAFIQKANAIHDFLDAQKRVTQQLFRLA